MPRTATLAADIEKLLAGRRNGATIKDITSELRRVRRAPVLRHSVRSAIYQHLDERGEGLFARLDRGRYTLRR